MDLLPEPDSAAGSDGPALIDALRAEVQPTTFKKGRDVARDGRVKGWSDGADGMRRGEVTGSSGEDYQVAVGLTPDGKVTSRCSCPAWGEYGPHCKHAVALAHADRRESLGPRPPELGRPGEVVPLPALAKLESWLGVSAAGEPSFVYRLAPAHPRASGRSWLFDVRRRDGKDGGPLSVKRFLSGGTRLSPPDERVFGELARHESRFDGKFILSDDDVADLLPLLRTRKVVYRGTALLFSADPARPQIHLSSTPGGARAKIEFQLPDGRTTGFETSLLLIGRRTTVLLESQTAYALEPDLPARLWRAWMREPSMTFPTTQVERALSFFAAHLPRIDLRLRADGLDVVEDQQPVFVLTLEGSAEKARAQLAARYGTATVPVSPSAVHLGYAAPPGDQGRTLSRRQAAAEREAGQRLLGLGGLLAPVERPALVARRGGVAEVNGGRGDRHRRGAVARGELSTCLLCRALERQQEGRLRVLDHVQPVGAQAQVDAREVGGEEGQRSLHLRGGEGHARLAHPRPPDPRWQVWLERVGGLALEQDGAPPADEEQRGVEAGGPAIGELELDPRPRP